MKKIFTSALLFMMVAIAMNADSAFAGNIPPYDPPIEAHVTVKWGNVNGTPYEVNKMSFDGSLSVSEGDVSLVDTLYFETHDDAKDQITSKMNPVSWTSWIYNRFDGIKAVVTADPSALVTIRTDAGSISVPYVKLLTAPRATQLKFGDGREIIIKVTKVVTDPFYLYAIWGGPVYTLEDEVTAVKEVENFARDLQVAESAEAFGVVLDNHSESLRHREDFSGSLSFENSARGKLVETILFEPGHGDQIIEKGENYVAWESYIYNHFDGLFFKVQLDQQYPIDDTVAVDFSEIGWSKSFSLTSVYVHGVEIQRVVADDKTYIVGLIAIKRPFCDRMIHGSDSVVCSLDVVDPVPLPIKPTPKPITVEPFKLDDAITSPQTIDVLTR
ncbi:hypothetical protein N8083_00470 [Candidatus Pacebacteria bacterium]|nr:hypothetical protein [Candidatus Paceibacterota bacterium]